MLINNIKKKKNLSSLLHFSFPEYKFWKFSDLLNKKKICMILFNKLNYTGLPAKILFTTKFIKSQVLLHNKIFKKIVDNSVYKNFFSFCRGPLRYTYLTDSDTRIFKTLIKKASEIIFMKFNEKIYAYNQLYKLIKLDYKIVVKTLFLLFKNYAKITSFLWNNGIHELDTARTQ